MGAWVSTELSILRITERAVAGSQADLAALADPINRGDWLRASRQSVSGNGFAREFALHADGAAMPAAASDTGWDKLFGADDGQGGGGQRDPAGLWRAVVPRGRLEPPSPVQARLGARSARPSRPAPRSPPRSQRSCSGPPGKSSWTVSLTGAPPAPTGW